MSNAKIAAPGQRVGVSLAVYGAVLAAVAGISFFLWTEVSRAREMHNRSACQAYLAAVSRAEFQYSANYGHRPATVQQLITSRMLDPAVASHLSHPVNYIFVPLSPGTHDPREVRAYEPIGNHGEGGNILYLDGHCKWHKRAEYESIVGPFLRRTAF